MAQLSPQRPSRIADCEVLPRLAALVERDNATTAEMLVLIGRAEARRLYAPTEYPSLFRYCVGKLRMSEDMAWKRIQAARAARRFPSILNMMADGRLHLTAVVRLAPHLTRENAGELLEAAVHLSKRALEELLAARFPRPDFVERVVPLADLAQRLAPQPMVEQRTPEPADASPELVPEPVDSRKSCPTPTYETRLVPEPVVASVTPSALAPRVTPLSPEHFGIQFMFGQEAHDKLRYAQALASHAVRGGALAEIFERALDAYISRLEKQKFAAASRPRPASKSPSSDPRHIPAPVAREVYLRDEGRCTFVSAEGQRCEAHELLEFHHVIPFADGGESTVPNLCLRCRTHNQLEAERAFGVEFIARKRQESRKKVLAKQNAAQAAAAERVRREARSRELASDVSAQERGLDALPWLRERMMHAQRLSDGESASP